MRTNTLILLAVLAGMVSAPLVRANEAGLSAQDVVRRYSQTVACQIFEESPSQYLTVHIDPGQHKEYTALTQQTNTTHLQNKNS